MDIDDLIAATGSPAGARDAAKARGMRESFEKLTLKCLRLSRDKRETDEETELDRSIDLLTREIASLPPTSIESLRAKISSALYWVDDGRPDPWRELAGPCMDAVAMRDLLMSFGAIFASDYKQRLDQVRYEEFIELRRPRRAQVAGVAPT